MLMLPSSALKNTSKLSYNIEDMSNINITHKYHLADLPLNEHWMEILIS